MYQVQGGGTTSGCGVEAQLADSATGQTSSTGQDSSPVAIGEAQSGHPSAREAEGVQGGEGVQGRLESPPPTVVTRQPSEDAPEAEVPLPASRGAISLPLPDGRQTREEPMRKQISADPEIGYVWRKRLKYM